MTLKDTCEITSGFAFRGGVSGEPGGGYGVVQLRDVDWDAGRVAWEDLPRVSGIEPGPHHLLLSGDILFAAKGQTNRAILVPVVGPTVTASTFFVIRPKRPDVLPAYVAWYLNAAPAQVHFQACSRGTNMRSVPKSCLDSLPLPLPPLEEQRRIADIQRLALLERELVSTLLKLRAEYAEAVCLRLARPS